MISSRADTTDVDLPQEAGFSVALLERAQAHALLAWQLAAAEDVDHHRVAQSGGGRRPYGYDHDRVTVRADEAQIIGELMRRTLAGESTVGLARELNERGVPTSTGGRWRTHLVTRLLCSARIAGWREHESGGHATEAHGRAFHAEAEWPAIVSRAEVEQVRALCASHRRTGSPRTYLLSGVASCGRCGGPMGATVRTVGKPIYLCVKQSDGSPSGCGTVSIQVEPADALIVNTLRQLLGRRAFVNRLTREKRTDLATRARLRRTRLAELDGFTGPGVFDEAWGNASLGHRRAVVEAVTSSIVVHPAPVRGSRAFDAQRIEWLWQVQR